LAEVAQVLAQGQEIVVESGDGLVLVEGDAGRLEQVLLNLLTNAINYAPGTDRIEVSVGRHDGKAELAVRDRGPGIGADALDDIFERFAQAPTAERQSTRGVGLGLYIAREILREHGGTIAVQSVPGEGATFTIRLPLLSESDSDTAPSQ
jgi:signal transduction histidine kinase